MPVSYALDLSGINPANLIQDEIHTVTEAHFRDYYFIVPNLAPFYIDKFSLSLVNGSVVTPLIEDVDFSFALPYVTGTRTTGKQMYGAVTLHNVNGNGILKMSYQTVGGNQVADRLHVLSTLADRAYNPRTTIFDILTNVPDAFPPVPHYQDYQNFYGQEQVVTALDAIATAIAQNSSLTADNIASFMRDYNSGNSSAYVRKIGDTMTGPLVLQGVPTMSDHAVNKAYVDATAVSAASVTTLLSNYVTEQKHATDLSEKFDKAGGTVYGPVLLTGSMTLDNQAVSKQYVDERMTQLQTQIGLVSDSLGNVSTGFVTKAYVDNLIDEIRFALTRIM